MESPKRSAPGKPFQSGRQFRKPTESGQGDRTYQPKEGGSLPKNERFQSGENRLRRTEGSSHTRPGKYQGGSKFPPRGKGRPAPPEIQGPKIHSDLQVTDGKYRGKMLKNSASPKAKLINRKLREIMFRLISRRVRAGRFLDLCAGAGIMGSEALSRSAMLATFVEKSARFCSLIRENMKMLGIKEGHSEIFEIETIPFLQRMQIRGRKWDVIFYGPPYDASYEEVLGFLGRGVCLRYRGALVIGHHAEMFFPETIGNLKRWRVMVEDDAALSFYERK